MTLFRKFLILFRTLFFFIRPELYIKQAEAIDLRLFVTHIQSPVNIYDSPYPYPQYTGPKRIPSL